MSNQKTKPLVVVTGPDKTFPFGWWGTRLVLWMIGLRAHYLTPKRHKLPDSFSGIIIGGGDDIEPRHYGLTGDAGATYDPDRDQLEIEMVQRALNTKIPILGICRGSQLINVVMGGNLHSDLRPLRKRTPNRNSITPIKWVDVESGSTLKKWLGKPCVKVNSLHHQAVKDVAPGLRVAARDQDEFIQSVESDRQDQFILGVQWHPEYMPYSSKQRRIFKALKQAMESCPSRK